MPKSSQLKIVIIGGGSVAWAPNLLRDMLTKPALSDAHYVLYDINKKASDKVRAFITKLANQAGFTKATFESTNQREKAFRGADYFIIAISTGGLDAMAHDLSIPEKFNIFHTVGDTSGPGGWSRLIRNFDVFTDFARDFNLLAPRAVILNYTNPMNTLTDLLSRLCKAPVVGLCHGLFENIEFLKQHYKLKDEGELSINYGGINHFFWADQIHTKSTDVLMDLNRRLQRQSFSDLLPETTAGRRKFEINHREVATELHRLTGMMPYLGDRHTSEFFAFYITSRQNLKKYKLARTSIAERRNLFRERDTAVSHELAAKKISAPWLVRSRETAADIIEAHSQNKVFIDVGNVPNRGQIANLPHGLVVETAVRVDGNGFSPITFGSLPRIVQGFIDPYAHLYPMTVDACMRKDRQLALRALRLDPVCAHLTTPQVNELGNQLLVAHRRFITAF
ncbi:MAG: hypothetical protein IT447_05720 [Phycisphaerales bacterium]|jgi:alpha-galactosidase|nr:hypothetical protein [Phycisphaerales bacterium]